MADKTRASNTGAEIFFKICDTADFIEKYASKRWHFENTCKTSCKNYGKIWACPPMEKNLNAFFCGLKNILIVALRISLTDANEFEKKYYKARKIFDALLLEFERELFEKNASKENIFAARAFFAGTCNSCPLEKCTRALPEKSPCPFPEKMRESLEALGFDLALTCEKEMGFELEWNSKSNSPKKLSLIGALGFSDELDEISLSCAKKKFENAFA